jgi:hypothetical protein
MENQENQNNAKNIINYILDRIYCQCESNGNFQEAVDKTTPKFREFIYDPNYNIEKDLDDDGNNISHLIAKYSLVDFYDEIKKHPKFDNIKNSKNKFDLTPYDIAKQYPFMINYISTFYSNNSMFAIPILVTRHYYMKAMYDLVDKMKNDNLIFNYHFEKTNKYLVQNLEIELSKNKAEISEETKVSFSFIILIIELLENEIFLSYNDDVYKKLEDVSKKKIVLNLCDAYLDRNHLNLSNSDSNSDSESENIIQDYD